MRVGIYADNTLPLRCDELCRAVNGLCEKVQFVAGSSPFRLTTSAIASPSGDATLSSAILAETADLDIACLGTHVPYDNNHFFDSAGKRTIISFSGWNSLTDLPVTNGFVYFIASILVLGLDIGTSHDENTGCINDFWWDKRGVDVGMRAAFICRDCLDGERRGEADQEVVADIQTLLDAVSQASRAGADVLELSPTGRAKEEGAGFDVFMCHSSDDKPAVRVINQAMRDAGINTWFDEEQLQPGQAWQPELERQIETIRCACVFVGKNEFGPWHANETRAFLNLFDADGAPVIPVLLPEAAAVPQLPIFLQLRMWTDLRENYDANLDQLIRFLRSRRPSEP